MKKLLSGNEAVARGAWEAGATVASGYPGTPSTEILETFARFPGVYAEWATNEKVAVDVAVGAAYAGSRAFATMKHVGLNVAADSLMYAATTGAEAGLVIVSADDPGMHSSQNEQDNRTFAKFARIPCLEPSDSQQAKDLTSAAFTLSERFDTPVLLRMTTRICHSTSVVELSEPSGTAHDELESAANDVSTNGSSAHPTFPRNLAKYVMVPGNAVKRRPVVEQRLQDIAEFAETFAGCDRGGRSWARRHHRWRRLPVRQGGLPDRVGAAPRHDLATASSPDPCLRCLREAPDRCRRAGPLHRGGGAHAGD